MTQTPTRIAVHAFGGPEQLGLEPIGEMPSPASGEVLIDVEAAGVNYLDIYQREGKGRYQPHLPFFPGLEGVGRVRAVGDHTPRLPVGQRVAWINVPGSYSSTLLAPADKLVALPDSLTPAQGLLFQALTAQYLVREYRDIQPRDRVLVHSAAGGVGLLLVQWFKHLGAWVVGTTSSETKAAAIRAAGADEVINYGQDYQFADEVLRLTDGHGVNLAIDGIGAATLGNSIRVLAHGGTVVSIGAASGPAPAIAPGLLTDRAARLAGGSVFTFTADPAEFQRRATEVIGGIQEGWLNLGQSKAYPLAEAAEAHRALESRRTLGKLYLTPENVSET